MSGLTDTVFGQDFIRKRQAGKEAGGVFRLFTVSDDFRLKKDIRNALKLVFDEKRLISTQEAASTCSMSVSKFRVIFKVLMHSSFSEFALKYRVGGAIEQLKNSNETQEAVALHWGFTDASHLHKYIKKFD